MAIREIRVYDDPILRKTCREVTEINERIRSILEDMADTLHQTENGAAIAAPQIGILRRLVVIDLGEGAIKLVNPVITACEGTQVCMEGCLSFPDKWGKVERPARVTVEAKDEWGEPVTISGDGLLAQCLSHELDHLDGKVFVDKLLPNEE